MTDDDFQKCDECKGPQVLDGKDFVHQHWCSKRDLRALDRAIEQARAATAYLRSWRGY